MVNAFARMPIYPTACPSNMQYHHQPENNYSAGVVVGNSCMPMVLVCAPELVSVCILSFTKHVRQDVRMFGDLIKLVWLAVCGADLIQLSVVQTSFCCLWCRPHSAVCGADLILKHMRPILTQPVWKPVLAGITAGAPYPDLQSTHPLLSQLAASHALPSAVVQQLQACFACTKVR